MNHLIPNQGETFLEKRKRWKRWRRIVGALVCAVVFCTTYALVLPAITLEKSENGTNLTQDGEGGPADETDNFGNAEKNKETGIRESDKGEGGEDSGDKDKGAEGSGDKDDRDKGTGNEAGGSEVPEAENDNTKEDAVNTRIMRKVGDGSSRAAIPADDETPPGNPKANDWQVVSHNYVNEISYTYSEDYSVRIRKKVEATGQENEFRIHLTVEPEAKDFQSFLDEATFGAVHNNSASLGGGVNTNSGWSPLYTEEQYQENGTPPAWVKVQIAVKFNGESFITVRYVDTNEISAVNNGNVGLWSADSDLDKNHNGKVDSREPIALAEKGTVSWSQISDRYTNEIDLTSIDLKRYLTVTRRVTIPLTVTDPMGEGITYTDQYKASSGTVTEPSSGNGSTLTWQLPGTEYSDDTKKVSAEVNGETHIYYKNAYTLEYTIRLTDYESCGLDESGEPIKTSNIVDTNKETMLAYRVDIEKEGEENGTTTGESQTTQFEIPQVVGLKYEIKLKKADAGTAAGLPGAKFQLYGDADCTQAVGGPVESDSSGIVDFTELEYGTYYLKEIEAPSGYKTEADSVRIYVLSYTTNRAALSGQGKDEEALYDDTENAFENTQISKNVILKKVSGENAKEVLQGAVFSLYADKNGTMAESPLYTDLASDAEGIFSPKDLRLSNGTYYLVETHAPDGYHLLTEPVMITVSEDQVTAKLQNASGHLTVEEAQKDGAVVYTVFVTNSSGYELPHTGGPGPYLYTFCGLALIAVGLMYGWKMRQKRERRYH